MKRIIRVFPRLTQATPIDELVRINVRPFLFDEADEVHVSVTFTWDLPIAEKLTKEWACVAPVKMGGPATGQKDEIFIPGLYIKKGSTITSRGCPNKCWFCPVWKRNGSVVRELEIKDGHQILDDNLLACSDDHVKKVFAMLKRQKEKPIFTGGLEAKRLKLWHAKMLKEIKVKRMFFAYDTPDDLEPLIEAGKTLIEAGFPKGSHNIKAYVLCGWPKDTMAEAEKRMKQTLSAGFTPYAMLYRDKHGNYNQDWRKFQYSWSQPTIIYAKNRTSSVPVDLMDKAELQQDQKSRQSQKI